MIASDDHVVDLWAMDEASREQFLPTTVSLIHQCVSAWNMLDADHPENGALHAETHPASV
ncbi:hypothetical protein ACVW1A_000216 [Bradyrhizobium sp. LB1.3]